VILAAVALVAAIAAAIGRRVPEALVAMAGAALLLVTGVLSPHDALDEAKDLAPTLVVLASLLVLGDGCERAGLFDALAARMALRARGSGARLLALVFAAAVATTAVLGLDATIVLLTPAAFAAAAKARLNSRPHVYACTHLANSASLILPISNLTNLLAFRASGLSFASFGAKMALPWAIAIAIEWLVLRRAFAQPLEAKGRTPKQAPPEIPKRPLVIVGLTLVGFVVAAPLHIDAAWPAAAGALAMGWVGTRFQAVDVPLLAFVLGLGLIVRALNLDIALPQGDNLLALLATTGIAAVAANLLNNVPALLVLLPAANHPATVLAVLIGVNCGPNLTYTGSLATLLWRRILRERDAEPSHKEFHVLGALTVPPILIAGTVALWLVT